MSNPGCVNDFEKSATLKIDKNAWNYYRGGAGDEQTLTDNCQAFKRYRLRPRVLNDVSSVDMTTNVLGSTLSFPVCVAPTAMHKLAHPDGETAVAKAAAESGVGFTLSINATTSMEEIHDKSNSVNWFQLYIYKDRDVVKNLVERAAKCGFTALFVSVDQATSGSRKVKNSCLISSNIRLENYVGTNYPFCDKESKNGIFKNIADSIDSSLDWSDIEWLKSITSLPIVLKGILTGEMAELAVKHKVDGIVVSNHGGRQLDGVPATIDALSEVIKAVNGRIEVYVDGGIRTGTDVLKAIALGAKTVFVGRPVLWALAHNGEEGVKEMLGILKQEFKTAMQLMGCASIADLQSGKNLVVHESYFNGC